MSESTTPTDEFSASSVDAEAAQQLAAAEQQVGHILSQLRLAVNVLLNRMGEHHLLNSPIQPVSPEGIVPEIGHLDYYTHQWAALVPESPAGRAALAHALSQKYAFQADDIPNIRQQLDLDDLRVEMAYQGRYGKPLETIYRQSRLGQMARGSISKLIVNEMLHDTMRDQLEWLPLTGGEFLFHQGDVGDDMYVIVSGMLRVVAEHKGEETVLAEPGRHDVVGEMALLTGEKRSAGVYAIRDSELVRVSRAAFEQLAKQHPMVMTQIAVQMVDRMRRMTTTSPFTCPATIAVVPITAGTAGFARKLAAIFSQHGTATLIDSERVADDAGAIADDYRLRAWLEEQETRHEFVIYEAEAAASDWTRRCIDQADRLVLVARSSESPGLSETETAILNTLDQRLIPRSELVLLHEDITTPLSGTTQWLAGRQVARHHHIGIDDPAGTARVMRFLRGRAVGLVLGGGGLRGAAHGGVVRALRELGITIDAVGGTSAGAIAGAEVALNWDDETMLHRTRSKLLQKRALLDYTLPLVAFTSGQGLSAALRHMLGAETMIEDMPLPYFCVSANLATAQEVIHRSGLLYRSVRASMSLPGVYPPVPDDNGDLLIDGGTFNNLPTNIMREVCDGGIVIAVKVSHNLVRRRHYTYGDSVSGWRVLLNRLNPFTPRLRTPGIVKTFMRASIIASDNARQQRMAEADLLIAPPVHEYSLFDIDSNLEMYDIGYRTALEDLKAWQAATTSAGATLSGT